MGGGAEGEEKADSLPSRETDLSLDPRTLTSGSEPKADAYATEPPKYPKENFVL